MSKLFPYRKVLILIIMSTIVICGGIVVINNYFGERVETYAKQKAIQSASDAVADVLTTDVLECLDEKSLIIDNENGIVINTIMVNNVLKRINNILSSELNDTSFKEVRIPYSIIFSEVLFSSLEYGIDVKVRPVGTYTTDIVTSIEEYGINNSLFKVDILVIIMIEILIPYNMQTVVVETSLPLVMQIIQGEVPPGIWYGVQ